MHGLCMLVHEHERIQIPIIIVICRSVSQSVTGRMHAASRCFAVTQLSPHRWGRHGSDATTYSALSFLSLSLSLISLAGMVSHGKEKEEEEESAETTSSVHA